MVDIYSEIKRSVEYHNSTLILAKQKNELEIENIIQRTIEAFKQRTYDFSNYRQLTLKQGSKKRLAKQYDEWSPEQFLCIYLKRCLDKNFKITYPNRNDYMQLLFGTISAVQNMKDFTVVKFDFEDFFNSISSEYVFLKYIKTSKLERFQKDLFEDFVTKCEFCYAGINTSNVMAEIVSKYFDDLIANIFFDKGLIFYRRYVDDGILVFNRFISEDECLENIEEAIKKVFYDVGFTPAHPCKTKLNKTDGKFNYISKRVLNQNKGIFYDFNFLGYKFALCSDIKLKTKIQFGLTDRKIQKYTEKITRIVEDYNQDRNMELLRHKLRAFSSRTVYRRKKYTTNIWKLKGFISNYNELRYHLNQLDTDTEKFLKDGIKDVFLNVGVAQPYFLEGKPEESPYSMYNNLGKNRTLLFEENKKIGIGKETLIAMCNQIGITTIGNKRYDTLLREYLIKIKVGH